MTGFKLFDEKYLLRPNTLTVIAAFTSVGKSALAMNIVQSVAKQGIPVSYFSLEMSNTELLSRLISKEAGLPGSVIMNKKLNEKQMDFFQRALNKNKSLPIYYDDRNNVDFNRTMRTVKNMVRTKGIKLAVIDYLQIYSQVSDDVEQSISYMARTAKNVAIETGIPIILLSQLNRSGLHPSIKMLRGSGQIEESADNIVLIDRPDAYPDNKVTKYEGEFKEVSVKNTAKLILAKGRGVGTGCALVGFEGAFTRFYEVEKVEGGNYIEHKEDLPF
jgi:replicative DNA helicase